MKQPDEKKKISSIILVVSLGIFAALVGLIEFIETQSPDELTAPFPAAQFMEMTKPAVPDDWLMRGNYHVGTDLPAGEYIIGADGTNLSNDIPTLLLQIYPFHEQETLKYDEVMYREFQYNSIVLLEEGQVIHGIGAFICKSNREISTILKPFEHGGMFRVGTDIPAGTYTVISDNESYEGNCRIYTDIVFGKEQNRLEEMIPCGDTIKITVQEGEYLQLEYAHLLHNES